MNLHNFCLAPKRFAKVNGSFRESRFQPPSVSELLSSPEGICLVSDSESIRGFVDPGSTSPSEDKFNAAVPDDDPNKRRTGVSVEDVAERL